MEIEDGTGYAVPVFGFSGVYNRFPASIFKVQQQRLGYSRVFTGFLVIFSEWPLQRSVAGNRRVTEIQSIRHAVEEAFIKKPLSLSNSCVQAAILPHPLYGARSNHAFFNASILCVPRRLVVAAIRTAGWMDG